MERRYSTRSYHSRVTQTATGHFWAICSIVRILSISYFDAEADTVDVAADGAATAGLTYIRVPLGSSDFSASCEFIWCSQSIPCWYPCNSVQLRWHKRRYSFEWLQHWCCSILPVQRHQRHHVNKQHLESSYSPMVAPRLVCILVQCVHSDAHTPL